MSIPNEFPQHQLTERVPCYELGCVPDASAVEYLEQRLKEESL